MKFAVLLLAFGLLTGIACGAERTTVWNGVYSGLQAQRGKAAYEKECSRCHRQDLSGAGGVLRGEKFQEHWSEDNLGSIFTRLTKTMPPSAPGGLPEATYLDVLSFILQRNDYPAGDRELKAAVLPAIHVEGKEGPQPVPDFALVQVVGCLVNESKSWKISNASEPVRTHNPNESAPAELKAAAAQPLGNHVFGILDITNLQVAPAKDHKVNVKGLLMRAPNADRLNVTFLEIIGPACP